MRKLSYLLTTLMILVSLPRESTACSCFEPGYSELNANSGTVPFNAAGVLWRNTTGDAGLNSIVVKRLTDSGTENVEFTVIPMSETYDGDSNLIPSFVPYGAIMPDDWAIGNRYQVTVASPNGEALRTIDPSVFSQEIVVVDPIDNGTLTLAVSGTHESEIDVLGCWGKTQFAYRDISVAPNSNWFDPSQFELVTYIDDKVWSPNPRWCDHRPAGASWTGIMKDRVGVSCDGSLANTIHGYSPGEHSIRVEARLRGTEIVFSSNEETYDFECESSGTFGGCNTLGGHWNWVAMFAPLLIFLTRRKIKTFS